MREKKVFLEYSGKIGSISKIIRKDKKARGEGTVPDLRTVVRAHNHAPVVESGLSPAKIEKTADTGGIGDL